MLAVPEQSGGHRSIASTPGVEELVTDAVMAEKSGAPFARARGPDSRAVHRSPRLALDIRAVKVMGRGAWPDQETFAAADPDKKTPIDDSDRQGAATSNEQRYRNRARLKLHVGCNSELEVRGLNIGPGNVEPIVTAPGQSAP